jgi:hypothetical protein
MRWITRERPKIDRVACPWLIARFIDIEAEFIFVPPDEVIEKAQKLDAIPYDVWMTPTKGFSSDADYPLGLLFWIQLQAGLSPVCPRLVTLTTFFVIPVGD